MKQTIKNLNSKNGKTSKNYLLKTIVAIILLLAQYSFGQNPVWSENFENLATNSNYLDLSSTKILANGGVNNSKCVEVEYERHQNGGTPRYLKKISITPGTEYTLSYDIFFDNDWNIATGGKYHGLVPNNTTSGCAPIEADGWSCRVVFDDRKPYLYTYHQDKDATCGDKSNNTNLQLAKNKWYSVSMHLKLNSADNVNNGFAKLYINGQLVATQNNREFRSVINNATKITQFYFSTFLGAGPTGTVLTRNHARFDNFGVYPGEQIRNSPDGETPTNIAPTVAVTAPANNAVFTLGQSINISANANDQDGTVSRVNFKINDAYYSGDTTAPYTGTFTPTATGTYKIAAKAFDNRQAETERFITITVINPTCSITPYVKINSSSWNTTTNVTVNVGDKISFGPQSDSTGGANVPGWSWTGPNNFTHTGRDFIFTNIQTNKSGTYRVTFLNANGCRATKDFNITIRETVATSTITVSQGVNGTINPSGTTTVTNGSNKTYTITPNIGYQINTVVVNGTSVGAVGSYTFTNVTSNKTITVTFKPTTSGGGNCLLARFGVPRNTAIPNKNSTYSKVYVIGTGGPNLANITSAAINWSLTYNGLYQLSFNTSNGNPSWYIDMSSSKQNFGQQNPSITFRGTGIANLDGNKYYINYVDTNNVVLVEITDKHAIYFSNSNTLPDGCSNAIARVVSQDTDLQVYPNPSKEGKFTLSSETSWELWSSTGIKIGQGKGATIDLESKAQGIYLLKTEFKELKLFKQ